MIKIKNLSISFGGHEIFHDINFIINDNEKIGLIGKNGCGKSTLLKLIVGKLEPDSGTIEIPNNCKIGYLEQHIKFTKNNVLDEVCTVLDEERMYESWKAEKILVGLGFTEEDMLESPYKYSGGYQIKINLAKLLLAEPDILLLDEPTNYLDIQSIHWLKDFLKKWKNALVLITHDRGFMDDIVTHTVFIHRGTSKKNPGGTIAMYEKIALEEEIYEKTRINEEKEREKTRAWIDRFRYKATKAKAVQSKIKAIEKQEKKVALANIKELDFKFNYLPYESKEPMLEVNKISFCYNENTPLIKNLSFKVYKGDKICVIGKNGRGKSTLLSLLNGNLQPNSGIIKKHFKTEIGYFGQMNVSRLNPNFTVYEELQNIDTSLPVSRVRQVCGNVLFSGDRADKKISVLSGGEKSRVMLGKILLKPNNLLLLDEPTNHLDMESCDALIDSINAFEGAVLVVVHSDYFISNVANKFVVFEENKIIYTDSYNFKDSL